VATLRLEEADAGLSVDGATPVRETRLASRSSLELDGDLDGEFRGECSPRFDAGLALELG
jgi:hypothetical protein